MLEVMEEVIEEDPTVDEDAIEEEDGATDEDELLLPQQPAKSAMHKTRMRTSASDFLGKIQTSFRLCPLAQRARAQRIIVNCQLPSSPQQVLQAAQFHTARCAGQARWKHSLA